MTTQERSEILSTLYRIHAESVALLLWCQDAGCLSVAVTATDVRNILSDKIDEMSGREVEARSVQLHFARTKY